MLQLPRGVLCGLVGGERVCELRGRDLPGQHGGHDLHELLSRHLSRHRGLVHLRELHPGKILGHIHRIVVVELLKLPRGEILCRRHRNLHELRVGLLPS